MGFSSEQAAAGGWAIAGIQLLAPLQSIYTGGSGVADSDERESDAKTPTSVGSRIPAKLQCSPPPRKRRAAAKRCNNDKKMTYSNGKKDHQFFVTPPDLEAVFIRRHLGC